MQDSIIPSLSQTVQKDTQLPSRASEKGKIAVSQALPSGWVTVAHESGGMVYLHKESRVVTLSRPYNLTSSVTVKVLQR